MGTLGKGRKKDDRPERHGTQVWECRCSRQSSQSLPSRDSPRATGRLGPPPGPPHPSCPARPMLPLSLQAWPVVWNHRLCLPCCGEERMGQGTAHGPRCCPLAANTMGMPRVLAGPESNSSCSSCPQTRCPIT